MTPTATVRALGRHDLRNVTRDGLLAPLLAVPVIIVALLRFGLPPLQGWLLDVRDFDLVAYHPVLLAGLVVLVIPAMFGAVAGVLVLDELDDGTLTALRVTPVGLGGYAAYRLAGGVAASLAYLLVGLPLTGLFAVERLVGVLPVLVLASLLVPLLGLVLVAFAANKVEGMAVSKGLSLVLNLPVLAWFTDTPWITLLGVVPTYWPVQAFWAAQAGEPAWGFVATGTIYSVALTAWLARRAQRRLADQG